MKENQMLSIVNKRDSFIVVVAVVVVISSARYHLLLLTPLNDGSIKLQEILCIRSRYTISSKYLFEVRRAHFLTLILIDTIDSVLSK